MDLTAATRAAREMLGPIADQISDEQWSVSAASSVLPDAEGRLPGAKGYVPTYDAHWLAAEATEAYAIAQQLTGGIAEFDSEGARFRLTAPDLFGAAAALRRKSRIARVVAAPNLGRVQVDGRASCYAPTSGRQLSGLANGAVVPAELDWT